MESFISSLEASTEVTANKLDLSEYVQARNKNVPFNLYNLDFFSINMDNMTCDDVVRDYTREEMKSNSYTVFFSIFSMVCTGLVATMMSKNKRLMAHPNKLIFYMCICEGIIAW